MSRYIENPWEEYNDRYDWTKEEEAAHKQAQWDKFLNDSKDDDEQLWCDWLHNDLEFDVLAEHFANFGSCGREDIKQADLALGRYMRLRLAEKIERHVEDLEVE